MASRGGQKGGGGPGRGRGGGTAAGKGGATPQDGAAVHAAAGDAAAAQGRKFTVAANIDELQAVVVPYPTEPTYPHPDGVGIS